MFAGFLLYILYFKFEKKKVHIISRIKGVKMISERIMEQCLGKKIKITYIDKS